MLVPKYRYGVFTKEVGEAIRDEIKKLYLWLKVSILEGHVCTDHVHLCVAIPLKYAISEVVATVKGKSPIRMFNRFPELKRKY